MATSLRCIKCKKEYDITEKIYRCECGSLLDVRHDIERLKETVSLKLFEARAAARRPYNSGVWRYKELVLPAEDDIIVTRGEGNTGLYSSAKVSGFAGVKNLLMKHEGENPTGSFKDRGMTAGITTARIVGATRVACASTGNTSSSMASYASLAGLRPLVFIPEGKIAYGKLSQTLAYGAETIEVRGNFDDAMDLVQKTCSETGIYLLNSLNACRLEGQKTIMFEMLQQMDWKVPDWVVVPGGNLGNASAFGKAFRELLDIGLIDGMPRVAVIQAHGANPLYRSYADGFRKHHELEDPETIASAIKIGKPVNYEKAVRTLRWTKGIVEEVSEQEIMDAKAIVDGSGIGAEPASCASVAGVRKLSEKGKIKEDESVVCILTGNMLKDPDATINYHTGKLGGIKSNFANRPKIVRADMKSVMGALR